MKIGIDVSQIVYGTGVSNYTKLLISNLLKIDRKNDYLLFGGSLRRKRELNSFYESLSGKFTGKTYPLPPTLADIIWNKFHFINIEKLVGKLDVFHSSDWTQPPSKAFKVTTVHDVIPLMYPSFVAKGVIRNIVKTHQKRLKLVKKWVDCVIVPSETTKADLVSYGIKEEKISVIPEAPSPIYKKAKNDEVSKLRKKYRIHGNYLISVGIVPRKNIERIIKAYEKVRAGENLKLVLIGEAKMPIEASRGVITLGYVPDEELPALYSGSEALLYPSFYEGFGLPILEAFSCQIPVVTSNLGSMKEVAGKAAVLVDPYDQESIVGGIKKALNNKQELIKKGKERVKQFSWKKTAEMTLNIYNQAK